MESRWRCRYSRKFLSEFINMYKSFPCLWEVQCADYSDRSKKNEAYQKLVEKYKEVDPRATKFTVKSKINSIRTSYRKEKRKVLYSKYYSNDYDGEYIPNLWYYNMLAFVDGKNEGAPKLLSMTQSNSSTQNKVQILKKSLDKDPDYLPTSKRLRMLGQEHNKTDDETNSKSSFRRPSVNIDSSDRGSPIIPSSPFIPDSIEHISEDEVQCTSTARSPSQENQESNENNNAVNNAVNVHPEPSLAPLIDPMGNGATSNSIRRRIRRRNNISNGFIGNKERNKNSPWKREVDCHDIFGRNVACKLRSLPNEQRIYLEKIINDAIFEAEMRNLNGRCFLHVPNPSMQDVLPTPTPSTPQVKLEVQ